jgi:signal transduction histidine kinase
MKQIQEEQNLFMASISHELRTPLTSILGYGELLENTNLDYKQEEYLSRMLHSSKYLLSLVGDFLDIVKIKKNDIKLDQKEIRLHTILTECVDVIKANLHKNVSFEVDIPFLDYTILADDRRIKQVMLNFLSNAAKFTQSGVIKFYVKDIVEIDENVKITVNIEDTGAGMSKEVQQALFDPFVTGDSTQGFGLGLFIVRGVNYFAGTVGSLFVDEWIIQQRECLRGDGAYNPTTARHRRVGHVKHFQHRHHQLAFHVNINAAAPMFWAFLFYLRPFIALTALINDFVWNTRLDPWSARLSV